MRLRRVQAVAFRKQKFEPETADQIPFSWGSKGDILFPRKENIPLNRSPCAAAGNF